MFSTLYTVMEFCIMLYRNKDLLFTLNRTLYMTLRNSTLKRIKHHVKEYLIRITHRIKILENYL